MKMFRWWGIATFFILIVLMIALWFLIAPMLIKDTIQGLGSEALGAKVEVNKVELTISPLGITLHQLTAADADSPMQNLVEFKKIQFAIDSETLLWKKILIDELVIDGVQTGTPRETSGALTGGRQSANAVNKIVEMVIPEVENFDAKSAVEKADLITLKRIKALQQSQQDIQGEWKNALDKDQFDQRINTIQQEYDRLSERAKKNKLNLLKDSKEWKQLKKDVDEERKSIAAMSDKIKQDKAVLSESFKQVKNGPQDDLKKIMDQLGLSNGVAGLVDQYIGPQYTPWVTKALDLINQFKADNKTAPEEEKKATVQVGKRVYYKDEHIFPELLIKNIIINGKNQQLKIDGTGSNLGYLPWLVKKPAKLAVSMQAKGNASFDLSSDWKSSSEMLTQLESKISEWPISAMSLMQTTEGQWLLNSGSLNANVSARLSLQTIDLNATFSIKSPNLSYPQSLSSWQKSLAESINQQTNIEFKLTAKGDLSDPKIKLDSSLEKVFQSVIGEQIKAKAQKLTGKVQQAITDKVGDISGLEDFNGNFDEWQKQLSNKDELLKGILGKIKL